MSLAVLKRKSDRFRNTPVSSCSSSPGFSLNGTLRNSTGFRLLGGTTRTPFKGALPRGHGTCCGEYASQHVSNSGSTVGINDPTIVKRSTVSDATMRDLKYRWIRGGTYPRVWVKDMGTAHVETKTQSAHIRRVSEATAAFKPLNALLDGCGANAVPVPPAPGSVECACTQRATLSRTSSVAAKKIRIVVKLGSSGVTVSQGQYLAGGTIGRRECLPPPATKQPFPFALAHDGCDVNYGTWQQAQAAGLLPPGYVG